MQNLPCWALNITPVELECWLLYHLITDSWGKSSTVTSDLWLLLIQIEMLIDKASLLLGEGLKCSSVVSLLSTTGSENKYKTSIVYTSLFHFITIEWNGSSLPHLAPLTVECHLASLCSTLLLQSRGGSSNRCSTPFMPCWWGHQIATPYSQTKGRSSVLTWPC